MAVSVSYDESTGKLTVTDSNGSIYTSRDDGCESRLSFNGNTPSKASYEWPIGSYGSLYYPIVAHVKYGDSVAFKRHCWIPVIGMSGTDAVSAVSRIRSTLGLTATLMYKQNKDGTTDKSTPTRIILGSWNDANGTEYSAPTCASKGFFTFSCTECGWEETVYYGDATGNHTYIVNGYSSTKANTTDGATKITYYNADGTVSGTAYAAPCCQYTLTYICTVCGDKSKTETVKATESHTAASGASWVTSDPYYHWKTCKWCGTEVGKAEHSWGSGEVTTDATCTESGVRTYTCTCGKTKTESIAAKGHLWSVSYDWESDNSHCTAYRVCSRDSSHNESEKVEATYKETKKATCVDDGTGTYTARFSASWASTKTKTVTIKATGHHTWGSVSYSWASSYTKCSASRTCSVCNENDSQSATVYDVSKDATCTEKGYEAKKAVFADSWGGTVEDQYEYISETSPLGHNLVPYEISGNDSYHGIKCTRASTCGYTPTTEEHSYGPWTIWVKGSRSRTCQKCSHSMTESSPYYIIVLDANGGTFDSGGSGTLSEDCASVELDIPTTDSPSGYSIPTPMTSSGHSVFKAWSPEIPSSAQVSGSTTTCKAVWDYSPSWLYRTRQLTSTVSFTVTWRSATESDTSTVMGTYSVTFSGSERFEVEAGDTDIYGATIYSSYDRSGSGLDVHPNSNAAMSDTLVNAVLYLDDGTSFEEQVKLQNITLQLNSEIYLRFQIEGYTKGYEIIGVSFEAGTYEMVNNYAMLNGKDL